MQYTDMFSLETHDGDETSISYRIAGDGPPLLLLHGFPQTNMMSVSYTHLTLPTNREV